MVPTFLPFWPQHIAFFHTHMHHWLQSTVQWVCLSKHPPGYGWKWQRSYQIHSQMLGRGKHQLKANNQKWNVKSCVQIWILTTCLHESQKVWNRNYSRVWTTNESNRHQKNRQLWQSPSSPVNVTLHLFASSLGYVSRRSCIWGSAGVPCIQMKAAICKVSVRGEQITGINV